MEHNNPYKIYVQTAAEFSADGQQLKPLWIIWEDGRKFEVDRVLRVERAVSRKAGGIGLRYTVMIGGHEHYLYYEENYRWFVEGR